MRTLTIKRSQWRRGGDTPELQIHAGTTHLLNQSGLMCCLGFDALACGVPRELLLDKNDPIDVYNFKAFPAYFTKERFPMVDDVLTDPESGLADPDNEDITQSRIVNEAIRINDSKDLSDAERETLLIPILKQLGYDIVEFVD